ncbi:TonB-dependent receptor [Membranicola marinus]|uniref:TonB-dependent receptor n=1 Tax=Membranihabitans marinus TaxID=1227546 RepID=A0A953HWI2_9BACT|nr:TonB-dependent receptor [Membranihabitans marinus]MBY5957856.1 TonB-dependent receptor [Membranihabitans marinus]
MNLKQYGISLAFLCMTFSGFSQNIIQGEVLDTLDHQPLVGALILVEPGGTGTVTDDNGHFEIKTASTDKYIVVRYLGYEEVRIGIGEDRSGINQVWMNRSSTALDEVIVSASPNSYKGNFKGSNFRISPIALKNINPLSTEEVLKTVPGVNIVGDMGLSNRPNISIRGSWGRRSKKVLLMEDGTPLAPAPYIAPGAYYNPVSDRITAMEVYKGADMLRYGPNNMYGAINYITALPPQKPELRVKLVGGERNYQTGLISYGGTWNNLGALVEGVYKSFDGFTDNSSVEVLNLNAKVFAKLSENQSLYFKVSSQHEDNQASLSSQTPFTFDSSPIQNPLDADQFTMRRYGVDIIHKWLPTDQLSFTSKVYASDFERDWWRQVTAKVKASEARNYLGEDIFNDRYQYLSGKTPGEEDYVIVGRVTNGLESTTDSRWTYTVAGIKETMSLNWDGFGSPQELEVSMNLHREIFKDRFLVANGSRWARHGATTKDLWYRLWSFNGFIRNQFNIGSWGVTPILRFEHVDMYRQDLMALAQNPDITGTDSGKEPNIYNQLLPGLTLDYQIGDGELYGSIYQGMIAPSKVFGFLVEQDGIVTNPLAGQDINIAPELSWNKELGWRGSFLKDRVDGQVTWFDITTRNFYAGGRNEIFEELGKINVRGVELAFGADLLRVNQHEFRLSGNVNFMKSSVLEGRLMDKDLFAQVIHSSATRQEYLDKVNANRSAFDIYASDGSNGEVLLTQNVIELSDFDQISKSVIHFGEDAGEQGEAPYTPRWNANMGLNYYWNDLSAGISGNYVSEQYTEFHNFTHESADGAIGQLPAFLTFDFFLNYHFKVRNIERLTVFVNGKNMTNSIYRASRLNRATSGVFGGGFRQIIFGVDVKI